MLEQLGGLWWLSWWSPRTIHRGCPHYSRPELKSDLWPFAACHSPLSLIPFPLTQHNKGHDIILERITLWAKMFIVVW